MAKEDQIIEALGTIKSSIRHIRRRTMRLGRYTSDVLDTTVTTSLPANYVWVFDPQGDKRVSSPAKNLTTEYGVGMAVIVAYNVDTQEEDVIGVDTVLAPLEQGSAAAGLNSPQKPAGIPTPISARDITVGGVFAASAGGLDVRIGAYWHENGYYADSTALTLVPTATSGKKSLAVVGVNRLTNAATYTLTADRSSAFTLIADGKPTSYAVTDIMAVVDAAPNTDWRGAVELANGATTINPAKIVPLPWLKAVMVGADGVDAGLSGLVPTPAAADDVKFLKGDGTWDTPSSGALDVTDGVTTVTGATAIDFTSGATVTNNAGVAEVAITGGGGGGATHSYVGYNTAGGSTETMTLYRQYMKKVTLATDGMIMSVGAYIKPSASANVMGFVVGVLSDNAGSPNELISHTPFRAGYDVLLDNSYSWVSMPIGVYCTAGDYWIAIMDTGSGGSRLDIAYDGSGADKYYAIGNPWMSGADGGYTATATTNKYSIRASFIGTTTSSGMGDYILIRDEKTQNTAGGNFTSGAWRTRTLNTEVADTGNHASISSNQISLAAGTYRVHITCPAYYVARHQAKLYNISDSADVLIGTSEFATTAVASSPATRSVIIGRFTIAATKTLEVQHRCQTTNSGGNGFGVEANFTTEVYTVVELIRE